MKTNNTCSIKTLIVVACLTSLGIQAAPRSTPVTVVNDATTPVPVTGAVEVSGAVDARVKGDVTVINGDANPVPVTGAVEANVRGAVTVENGPANPVPVVIADPVKVNMGTNYRYIGTTTAGRIQPAVDGIGLDGMNTKCQDEYGSAARMCTTKEFFQSPVTDIPRDDDYWIHPTIEHVIMDPVTNKPGYQDYSGRYLRTSNGLPPTCDGWRTLTDAWDGAVLEVFSNGIVYVNRFPCGVLRAPLVCCTPQ